eukprot:2881153-Amphidinium_carterae.1
MLPIPTTHQNKREPPTPFEGNNKSGSTAGSTTTFKNWSAEFTSYMSFYLHEFGRSETTKDLGQLEAADYAYTIINDESYADSRVN